MSKEHLISAYMRGELGRRQFVRGLLAVGVALTAALSYAELNAAPAQAAPGTANAAVTGLSQACLHMPDVAKFHSEFCGA